MKREKEEEMRNQRGGVSFFFYDLSNMSGATGLLYIGGIIAFFGLIFYVMFSKLFIKPVDFKKKKQQERQVKKTSSSGTSGKQKVK